MIEAERYYRLRNGAKAFVFSVEPYPVGVVLDTDGDCHLAHWNKDGKHGILTDLTIVEEMQ